MGVGCREVVDRIKLGFTQPNLTINVRSRSDPTYYKLGYGLSFSWAAAVAAAKGAPTIIVKNNF
jgi:hypothetical protein